MAMIIVLLLPVVAMLCMCFVGAGSQKQETTIGGPVDSLRPLIPSMEESGFQVTALSVHHSSSGPWQWGPVRTEGVACTLNFNAIVDYKQHPQFNTGGTARLSGHGTGPLRRTNFDQIPCHFKNAFALADNQYGKDSRTLSVAVVCTVGLDVEIGKYSFRHALDRGRVCRTIEEVDVTMTLHMHANKDENGTALGVDVSSSFTSAARMHRAPVTQTQRPHEPKFSITTVSSFESSYTPYMLFMWVQHHLALGLIVIVYDRGGSHKDHLESVMGLADFYYFPFTVMERLHPTSYGHHGGDKNTLSLFYGTEKSHKANADTNHLSVNKIDVTLMMDRDKQSTMDHARMEFSALPGMLFADADEFLYCPGAGGYDMLNNRSATNALHYQRHRVNHELWQIKGAGVEEIRVDTHPYRGPLDSTLDSIHDCLMAGFHVAMTSKGGSLAHDLDRGVGASGTVKGLAQMHACFSNSSTVQTWQKSMDLGQRCPFHYNHWSCDGGRAAGRQIFCRCRVGVRSWSRAAISRVGDTCHLLHYNPHAYNKHEHSRGQKGPALPYEGRSPIASMIAP